MDILHRKAIRLQPDLAEAYYNRGIAYFIQGNNKLPCRTAKPTRATSIS